MIIENTLSVTHPAGRLTRAQQSDVFKHESGFRSILGRPLTAGPVSAEVKGPQRCLY